MNLDFNDAEYERVRPYLLKAFEVTPAVFTEDEMVAKLRSKEWLLLTTENAACVLQFFHDGEDWAANILLIGGRIGGSLREIMTAHQSVCDALRKMGFAYLCGTPRPEFAKYLIKNGFFEQAGKELRTRLN